MTKEKRLDGFYIDLDSLLDTRLGSLAKIGQQLSSSAIKDGYFTRDQHVPKGVSKDVFDRMYRQRDVETLKNSGPTLLLYELKSMIASLNSQAGIGPYSDGARIEVNLWPYNLASDERELFRKAIRIWIGDDAELELVTIRPEELTPLAVKDRYGALIKYDYEEWIKIHSKAFSACPLPSVLLLAPMLYFQKKPTPEELEEMRGKVPNPFSALELYSAPFIELRLIDPRYFNFTIKDRFGDTKPQPDVKAA